MTWSSNYANFLSLSRSADNGNSEFPMLTNFLIRATFLEIILPSSNCFLILNVWLFKVFQNYSTSYVVSS